MDQFLDAAVALFSLALFTSVVALAVLFFFKKMRAARSKANRTGTVHCRHLK